MKTVAGVLALVAVVLWVVALGADNPPESLAKAGGLVAVAAVIALVIGIRRARQRNDPIQKIEKAAGLDMVMSENAAYAAEVLRDAGPGHRVVSLPEIKLGWGDDLAQPVVVVDELLVRVGEVVRPEQLVATIHTNGADEEVYSPGAGVVTQLLAAEGDRLMIQAPLLVLRIEAPAEPVTVPATAPVTPPPAAAPVSLDDLLDGIPEPPADDPGTTSR